jgi:hypothetical protein
MPKSLAARVDGEIFLDLADLLDYDIEALNDRAERDLGEGFILSDIGYKPVRVDTDGAIVVRVTATREDF